MRRLLKTMDTRSAEILSAFISIVLALGMFVAPAGSMMMMTMHAAGMLPEWPLVMAFCSGFCLIAQFFNIPKLVWSARFLSGCVWGTIVMVFGNQYLWLPFFWVATVMLSFDFYLVTVKGQIWKKVK